LSTTSTWWRRMIRIFFYHVQKKTSVEEICEENLELSQEREIAKTVDLKPLKQQSINLCAFDCFPRYHKLCDFKSY
jgi:hypothetical protein